MPTPPKTVLNVDAVTVVTILAVALLVPLLLSGFLFQ
jgi:hypothetical protein